MGPKPPSILPGREENKSSVGLLYNPGQPVLVDLPTVGQVPLTLKTSLNVYSWIATNAHGKEHKFNTRWILPS